MHTIIKNILAREKISARALAKAIGIHDDSLRRMLRKEIKMPAEVFENSLEHLGYKMVVVKKEDIL